LNNIQKQSRRF